MNEPWKIFISYNQKDREKAIQVLNKLKSLGPRFTVWFDRHSIEPGERLSDAIMEGLNGANYYLILISENSNKSEWVKRELSAAFDLSRKKGLALVPLIIDDAETPLEFKGQLTIDARGDNFQRGLEELFGFFARQMDRSAEPKQDGKHFQQTPCEDILGAMNVGNLRFLLTNRLTVPDIGVLWFDLFEQPIESEVVPTTLAQYCVTLITKSQREDLMPGLYKLLCRNHPRLRGFAEKM